MNKLLELIEKLEYSLSKDPTIIKIKAVQSKIYANKDLLSLIEEYKLSKKEDIKQQIYQNKDFCEFKRLENDINIMILKINSKLKNITNKGKCEK